MSYVLAHELIFASVYLKVSGVSAGLMCGFFNWLGFIAPVTLEWYFMKISPGSFGC